MGEELDQAFGTIGSYGEVVRRRRWWLLGVVIVCWSAAWGAAWILPRTYQSEAVIAIEKQDALDPSAVPNPSASLQNLYQILSEQVLAPARLRAIIDRHHLYAEPERPAIFAGSADPVERMRRDIEIEIVPVAGHSNQFTAFKVRYSARSPELAQEITREIVAPLTGETPQARTQASDESTVLLENQIDEARREMDEMEARVAEFQATRSVTLPGLPAARSRAAAPKLSSEGERQLAAITREYENAKAIYAAILQEQIESESAAGREEPESSPTFRIVRPPVLPAKALFPDRFKFSVLGSVGGVFLGLALIVILEFADVRIRHEQELKNLPVHFLVSIPPLNTADEKRKRAIGRWLDACGVTLALGLIVAGNYLAFFGG